MLINNILVFAENHDTNRFEIYNNDIRKYKMAMAVLATFAEFLNYYGSEIGMSGVRKKVMQTFELIFQVAGLAMKQRIQKEDLKINKTILILQPNYFNGKKPKQSTW
jgi:glycosidase